MNNIEIKIKFWVELWEDLIDNFLKKSYGLNLYNPHILIEDIITEIEENSFKNSDNKKFFYSKIDEYFKHDIVINKKLKSQFTILRKIFNSDRTGYTLETCKEINTLFKTGLYFDYSLELLIGLILSEDEISLEFVNSINYFTQGIIVEFIKKSYNIEDIKKFPNNIFYNYDVFDDNTIHTEFPHQIDSENYNLSNGEFDRDSYNKSIIDYMSNLTFKDRLSKLSYYFYKEKTKAKYIFVVEGLKGDFDISISGVNFYSTKLKTLVTQNTKRYDWEGSLQSRQGEDKFILAAVEVDFLMAKSSRSEAVTKLENALDLISCCFSTTTDIQINDSNYLIVNEAGRCTYSSNGRDKKDSVMRFHNSLNLKEIEAYLYRFK